MPTGSYRPLIPQHFIDELVARADLAQLVGERVPLRRRGRDFWGCCPFHDEKTPSFKVDANEHYFKCFGCGASGNAIGFLIEMDRLSFPEAVEALAAHLGMEVPHEGGEQDREAVQHLHDLRSVMARSAEWFRQQLQAENCEAVEYLRRRGVNREIAERFGLGFVPEAWDGLHRALGGSRKQDDLLVEAGMLVRKDDGRVYDRFRGRVMFPIRDRQGRTIAFGGRVMGDGEPKYLNSPESPLFHKSEEIYGLYEAKEADRRMERLLVVEGYMDVIALAQHGIPWSVATLGTALTEQHLRKLFRIVPEVIFSFDGDNAGRAAARKALEAAAPRMEEGLQARFLILPQGEDPDSLVRREGPAAFARRVQEALPFSEFIFEDARHGIDTGSLEGQAQVLSRVEKLARKVPNPMLSRLILQRVQEESGQRSPPQRPRALRQPQTPSAPPWPAASHAVRRPQPASSRHARTSMDLIAVRCLLHRPSLVTAWEGSPPPPDGTDARQLLIHLLEWLEEDSSRPHSWLIGRAAGVSPQLEALLKAQLDEGLLLPMEHLETEFLGILRKISAANSEQQKKSRRRALQEASRSRPLTREEMLELQELIRQLAGLNPETN